MKYFLYKKLLNVLLLRFPFAISFADIYFLNTKKELKKLKRRVKCSDGPNRVKCSDGPAQNDPIESRRSPFYLTNHSNFPNISQTISLSFNKSRLRRKTQLRRIWRPMMWTSPTRRRRNYRRQRRRNNHTSSKESGVSGSITNQRKASPGEKLFVKPILSTP